MFFLENMGGHIYTLINFSEIREYEFYHCQNLDKFGLMNMYTLGGRIHTRVRIRTNFRESVAPRLSQLPVQ